MTEREKLIELLKSPHKAEQLREMGVDIGAYSDDCIEAMIADFLLANNVNVQPVKVGDEIWVIEREDGDAIAVSCIQFLAKSKGCIIGSAWINNYDIDETLESLIEDTQAYFDCDLKVYPEADCFATEEEVKTAFEKEVRGE